MQNYLQHWPFAQPDEISSVAILYDIFCGTIALDDLGILGHRIHF